MNNKETAVDSFDVLDALLGKNKKGRPYLVEESFTTSIRRGNWKYIAPQTQQPPLWLINKNVDSGLQQVPQLYDLEKDPGEKHNLATQMPEKTKSLAIELAQIMKTPSRKMN